MIHCTRILLFALIVFAAAMVVFGDKLAETEVIEQKTDHYTAKGYTVITAGTFPLMPFDSKKNYIVVSYPFNDKLHIPAGQMVEIKEAGVRIFFEPAVRVEVEGKLKASFLALDAVPEDDLYLGNIVTQKRWRGILITKIGSAALDNTVIRNTDSALVSLAPPEALKLECIDLPSDAACPVNILGNCPRIDSPTCFTLREGMMNPDSGTKTVSMQPGKPDLTGSQTGNRKVLWKNVGLWSSAGFGAVAFGTGIAAFVFDRQARGYLDEGNNADTWYEANKTYTKRKNAIRNRDYLGVYTIGAGIIAASFGVVYIMNF